MVNKIKSISKRVIAIILTVMMLLTSGIVGAVAANVELVETGGSLKTVYLNPGGSTLWDQAGAWFAAWVWKDNGSGWWIRGTAIGGGVYSFTSTDEFNKVKFLRMASGATDFSWNKGDTGYWNQTGDIVIPDNSNCYTITGWNANDGTWSTYTPPVTKYKLTVEQENATGTIKIDDSDVTSKDIDENKTAKITVTPPEGYTYSISGAGINETNQSGSNDFPTSAITSAQTVTVTYNAISYDVTADVSPAGAGTVTGVPTVPGSMDYNSSVKLTANANDGYRFDHWKKNGTKITGGAEITVTVGTENNYTAVFVKTYTVNITDDRISGNFTVKVGSGSNQSKTASFTQVVDEGTTVYVKSVSPQNYYISSLVINSDSSCVEDNENYLKANWYTFEHTFKVTNDLTISIGHSPNPTVTIADDIKNGTLTHNNKTNTVDYKQSNVEITATPEDGYYLYQVIDTLTNSVVYTNEDKTEGVVKYTLPEIRKSLNLKAEFLSMASTDVQFTQSGAGTVQVNDTIYTATEFSVPVTTGRSFTFAVTAPDTMFIQAVIVNGTPVYSGSDETKEDYSYTVNSVTGEEYPITIVYGNQKPRTVTVLPYDTTDGTLKYNGTAIPAEGMDIIAYTGDDVIITAVPANKHAVKAWTVDGAIVSSKETSYIFSKISGDHDITVDWEELKIFTMTAQSNPGGAATTTASKSTFEQGDAPITFTTTLTDPCFKFKKWSISGSYTGTVNTSQTSITLTPTSDITATAVYEQIYRKIYLKNDAGWYGTMRVYYWNSDLASTGYPGVEMTYNQSLGYWEGYIPIDAKNVKFNNGGNKPATGDIDVVRGRNIYNNGTNVWEERPYVETGYYLWGTWNGTKHEAFDLLKFYNNGDGTYSYDIFVTSTEDGYIYVIPSDEDSNFYTAATNGATGNPQTLTASGYLAESARKMIKIEIDPNNLNAKCDVRVTFNPTTREFSWSTSMRPETVMLTGTDGRQKNQSDNGWTTNDGDPARVGDTTFDGENVIDLSSHNHHDEAEVVLNKPVTISTQVHQNAAGTYDYYVAGWVVNGVGWIDASPQGNGLYTATKTFAEDTTLVPIYYHTTDWLTANSTTEVTVYAVMDKSIKDWDQYMSAYTWYKKSTGAIEYEQFGEYSGQLMKPVVGLDGVYTTKIETSAPGKNGVAISGITFVNYGYAYNDYAVSPVVDYTHIQTYDYYEFIALNNAGKQDITFVIKNTNDTQNDDRIPNTLNINGNWDFVEFTDYSGIKTDIWGTDIDEKWDTLSDNNAIYIVRQGDIVSTKSPLNGQWYVKCHLYDHSGKKIGDCFSYELSDPNAAIWSKLGDYKLQRCWVSYEKGRYYDTDNNTHTTRYDGQWYGDAEGVAAKVKLQVQVALLPEGATEYILNETAPINEANYGKAYINGTKQSYDATRTTEKVSLNAINMSGFKFKGWYTAGGTQFATKNAETVTASVGTTYIAVFEPLTKGEFYVDHFIYSGTGSAGFQPIAHKGNAILSVQIENKTQKTISEEISGEGNASASLEATEGDELYITITTDGLGADKFYAWYTDAVNKNGETTFEEVGVDSDDNLYPNSGNTVVGTIDKVGFKFKYIVKPRDSMHINLYSDLTPVSSEITLIYQYNDRYDNDIKFYYVPYTLTDNEIKGFAGNNNTPFTPAYITGEGWVNTVADKAPWISDYYKDCSWEIDVENNLYDPTAFHLIATQPPKEYTVTINTGSVEDKIEKHGYNDLLSLDANDLGIDAVSGKGFWYEDLNIDGKYDEGTDKIITYNAYYGYRVTRDIHIGYAKFDGELDFNVTLDEPVYGREQTTDQYGGNATDKILVDYMINIVTPNFYGHDGWTDAPIYKGETIEENWNGSHVTIESYENVKNVDIEYGVIVEQFGASIKIDEKDENGFINAEKEAENRGYKTPVSDKAILEQAANLANEKFITNGNKAYIKYEAFNDITNYNRVLFTIKYSNTESNRGRFFNVYGYVKITDKESGAVKYYFSDVRYHNIYETATQS